MNGTSWLISYRIALLALVFWGADCANTTMVEQRATNQTIASLTAQLIESKTEQLALQGILDREIAKSDALDEALYQLRMELRMAKGAKRL